MMEGYYRFHYAAHTVHQHSHLLGEVFLFLLFFSCSFVSSTFLATATAPVPPLSIAPTFRWPQTTTQNATELIVQYQQIPLSGTTRAPGASAQNTAAPQHALVQESFRQHASPQTVRFATHTFHLLPIPDGANIDSTIASLQSDPQILSVEPNLIRHITALPNDVDLHLQWHLVDEKAGIQSPNAWDTQTGATEVIVAIIDTGVDINHPDLADNLWNNPNEIAGNDIDDDNNGYVDDVHGVDLVDNDGNPTPEPDGVDDDNFAGADTGTEHGTHVAGIIASVGNNEVGGSGVAWNLSIMGVKAIDEEGSGTDIDIAEAIQYAVDNGAHIINLSLGGYGSTSVLESAVTYATDRGVMVIAATGNDGIDINTYGFYPACYDDVVGVGSTSQGNEASTFSNYGSNCVDLSAPGELIYSTLYTDDPENGFTTDYGYMTGTSMAAPVVVGAAGLLKSQDLTLDFTEIANILVASADDINMNADYGSGRLNAEAALQNIQIGTYPKAPASIALYKNPEKIVAYQEGARTDDATPYFEWNASEGTNPISGYYVYFGTDTEANPVNNGQFQTDTSYTATIEGDANNRSYVLRVVAVDTAGYTSVEVGTVEYMYDTLVHAPEKVQAQKVSDGVRVRWNKVKKDFVEQYRVMRRTVSTTTQGVGSAQELEPIGVVAQPTTSFVDSHVRPGVQYEYVVQAVDDLKHRQDSDGARVRFTPRERVVVAAGAGGGPQIRVYNTKKKRYDATWYAFAETERTGVEIAVGNLDDDAKDEIVAARGSGAGPEVRLFTGNGKETKRFTAYESSFTGGVHVAVGQMDADAEEEIIVAPGSGHSPEVRVFDADGTLQRSFLALDGRWSKGVQIASVNWDGKGTDEIAVAPDVGGADLVYIYSSQGKQLTSFDAGYADSGTGLRLSRFRGADAEEPDALVTAPLRGTVLVKRFIQQRGVAATAHNGFYGFVQAYSGGGTVSAGDVAQRGEDRILIGSNGGRTATVNIYNLTGGFLQDTLFPFGGFQGPVTVAAGWL